MPDYIVLKDSRPEMRKLGNYTDYNHSDNQIQMIGISCLESVSELQGVPHAPRFRAPELLLDGQLSPKGDIWMRPEGVAIESEDRALTTGDSRLKSKLTSIS